jgi:hypothetical protein
MWHSVCVRVHVCVHVHVCVCVCVRVCVFASSKGGLSTDPFKRGQTALFLFVDYVLPLFQSNQCQISVFLAVKQV